MNVNNESHMSKRKEILFQFILNLVLFFSYAIESSRLNIELWTICYYLNYALGALFINYVLLPRFFYKEKYKTFVVALVLLTVWLMFVEELVLEPFFFPESKGSDIGNIFYTLVDVLPVMMLLVGFKFAWDSIKRQQELNQLKALVKESELQFLKTQINPHFLFNNLNNLYSYAIENSAKTPSIILELASVLRYMLYDCKEDFVPLEKEIEHVQNFTKLNELQIENRGRVTLDVPEMTSEYKIAPLILNVFIENAFKHSTASQSQDIFVDIALHVEGDQLSFKCSNSFGNQSNSDNLTKGIGLGNVKKRLDFLYENEYDLNIDQKSNVYEVALKMRLKR
ncbi:sensor histidine kinase [Formosa sp. S-31]|uniref:sensor histidine kinase n=1 Tax=Formosa sp. S-31 TaxID=2790949 RepID=UPI003EBF14AD